MRHIRSISIVLILGISSIGHQQAVAFSLERTSPSSTNTGASRSATTPRNLGTPPQLPQQPVGNILILDHLNINHEKGRHDLLKAFYFDFLNLVVDPRKEENLATGRKTVWANIGAQQFHLPEGKPGAQVLEGVLTLSYPSLEAISERVETARTQMADSRFDAVFLEEQTDGTTAASSSSSCGYYKVTDPWGTSFCLVQGPPEERDVRGKQPGPGTSEGLAMRDLTIYTPKDCSMPGIARFYQQILGAPILDESPRHCVVSVGPFQTLTFREHPEEKASVQHEDLRDETTEEDHESQDAVPAFPSNYGPHVSMYIADLPGCYQKAQDLGIAYVNPRFKRRAYTLEQAVDDCMFRILDIKDPEAPEDGVILRLEHEIRSVVNRDGSMYRSCPFDEIPEGCRD